MSWADRVDTLAVATLRDPSATPEERAEAKRALTEDRASAVATLLDLSRRLSEGDRAALERAARLLDDPSAPYAPPRECPRTIGGILDLYAELDPDRKRLTALIATADEPA